MKKTVSKAKGKVNNVTSNPPRRKGKTTSVASKKTSTKSKGKSTKKTTSSEYHIEVNETSKQSKIALRKLNPLCKSQMGLYLEAKKHGHKGSKATLSEFQFMFLSVMFKRGSNLRSKLISEYRERKSKVYPKGSNYSFHYVKQAIQRLKKDAEIYNYVVKNFDESKVKKA